MSRCKIDGCAKSAHWRDRGRDGYCASHFYRLQRHGDPLGGRTSVGEAAEYFANVVMAYEGDECLFWPYAKNSAGYGHLRVNGKNQLVHRMVCERVNGAPPTIKHQAAHSCNNGHLSCCNKRHLSWKTAIGNAADKFENGTTNQGEKHYACKLTEHDVRFIRSTHLSNAELARRLSVDPANIAAVRNFRSWRHVQ